MGGHKGNEMSQTLEALELLALSKFDESKKVRDAIEAGEYEVDEIVRISGSVKVGEDHEARVVASIPWMRVASVLFDKLNDVTIESVLSEALGDDVDDSRIKEQAEAAIEVLKGSTTKTRKGAVKVALTVESIGHGS